MFNFNFTVLHTLIGHGSNNVPFIVSPPYNWNIGWFFNNSCPHTSTLSFSSDGRYWVLNFLYPFISNCNLWCARSFDFIDSFINYINWSFQFYWLMEINVKFFRFWCSIEWAARSIYFTKVFITNTSTSFVSDFCVLQNNYYILI